VGTSVAAILQQSKIDSLDAELLLAHVLEKDRSWLLAHGEMILTPEQEDCFYGFMKRRIAHEPMAYILREKEFYGRMFFVDRRVLIPRPATETLIDEVIRLYESNFQCDSPRVTEADTDVVILTHLFRKNTKEHPSLRPSIHPALRDSFGATQDDTFIIDVGTGSGCIAITLAQEIPNVKIIASDISAEALEVAKMNAKRHGVLDRIEFVEANGIPHDVLRLRLSRVYRGSQQDVSNLRTSKPLNLTTSYLLVSNPPYIQEGAPLPSDVSLYEPHAALFAGSDGMSVIMPLIEAAQNDDRCIGFCMEMGLSQAKKVLTILS